MHNNVILKLTVCTIVALTIVALVSCAPAVKQKKPASDRSLIRGQMPLGHDTGSSLAAKKHLGEIERTLPRRYTIDNIPILTNKSYSDMYFRYYGTNPTIDTSEENVSTFSATPDTASYTIAKAYLSQGRLPPEAAVRVEEFINTFDYRYRAPKRGDFNIDAEAFPSPNRRGYHVLRLGIKGKTEHPSQRKPANLVFVIDISASMNKEKRLRLVKKSLQLLVNRLKKKDILAIVAFNNDAYTVLNPTPGHDKGRIRQAVDGLKAGKSSNLQRGLLLGYRLARKHHDRSKTSRVILVSDGIVTKGAATAEKIFQAIGSQAGRGVYLATVGVGQGNYNDRLLQQLARRGNGNYTYLGNLADARRLLANKLLTMQLLAKDLKIQVVFDKTRISRFRLLGYESRMLKNESFRSNRRDAGEISTGHAVTALYEIKFRSRKPGRFAWVRIRYKTPGTDKVRFLRRPLTNSTVRHTFSKASASAKLSYIVATFAEKLRGSYWARNVQYKDLLALHHYLPSRWMKHRHISELHGLIKAAKKLDKRGDKFESRLPLAEMTFDHVPILR